MTSSFLAWAVNCLLRWNTLWAELLSQRIDYLVLNTLGYLRLRYYKMLVEFIHLEFRSKFLGWIYKFKCHWLMVVTEDMGVSKINYGDSIDWEVRDRYSEALRNLSIECLGVKRWEYKRDLRTWGQKERQECIWESVTQ